MATYGALRNAQLYYSVEHAPCKLFCVLVAMSTVSPCSVTSPATARAFGFLLHRCRPYKCVFLARFAKRAPHGGSQQESGGSQQQELGISPSNKSAKEQENCAGWLREQLL